MFHSRFNVDQPMRSSWQVVDALLRAVDLAALFVFQSEAYTCHREVSWVPAFRWWKTFTLTRKLTLCPGPSPYFLQEEISQKTAQLCASNQPDRCLAGTDAPGQCPRPESGKGYSPIHLLLYGARDDPWDSALGMQQATTVMQYPAPLLRIWTRQLYGKMPCPRTRQDSSLSTRSESYASVFEILLGYIDPCHGSVNFPANSSYHRVCVFYDHQ